MILDINEKIDVNPRWFEEQAKRDPAEAWSARLCELLSVYRVKDTVGAEDAAKRMMDAGLKPEKIQSAME